MIEEFRNIILIVVSLITTANFVGTYYVYRYKVKVNCRRTEKNTEELRMLKEEKIPYFITDPKHASLCADKENRFLGSLDKLEKTILKRLDRMDNNRESSRDQYADQVNKRIEIETQLTAALNSLTRRVEQLENKIK